MAEAILFTVAAEILKKLASPNWKQISLAASVKRDLIQLQETLETIKAVLLDAQQKQSTNHQLRLWLQTLQDVLYDADNVLDEFAYVALQQQLAIRGNSITKVRQIFTNVKFRFGMGYKIKEIRERLDQIASNRARFNLTEGVMDGHVIPREMTHSFVASSDIIGRDKDTTNIVRLLTSSHTDLNLFVVPIVGIGGLGKTTIAKLVYNDNRVANCFQQKMWVCVSDNFELKKVIKDIITEVDPKGNDCSNLSINQLQIHLRGILQDKKFLLVLDDVWNEDKEKWKHLEELLTDGAKGSAIIVTTRSLNVASIMGTIKPYILERLSDTDCWCLFAKCAFEKGKEKNYPNLVRIGNDIIKKCKGVPLAVTSLGSMLFMKTDKHEWRSIEESDIWRLEEKKDGILAALRLSYHQLPSHLKQCFAFCSIMPKDYIFYGNKLALMWMSHGLIQSSLENEDLEEIGLRYIRELYSRCFFQDLEVVDSYLKFKMHDLVHDLAISVAQNESYTIINHHVPSTISYKLRHLLLHSTKDVPSVIFDWKDLRTVFNLPFIGEEGMGQSLVETCITRFKFLRILYLPHSCFEMLSDSLGSLIHLRYLDISCNCIMKKLPDAICKLLHLQTLLLYECSELEGLPRDIGNLINLRALSITAKKLYLLPNKEIGLLSSLRILYLRDCPNLITSDERIECLPHLRILRLENCDNLVSWPGILKHLPALETLVIGKCMKMNQMDSTHDTHDFNFPSLRCLHIVGLTHWKTLPNWIPNLRSLHELSIKWCYQLSNRCKRGGEDWHKISHIPNITIDDEEITRSDDDEVPSIDPTYNT